MGITHVVRGEEWISSTPKHVLLYDWLGWERAGVRAHAAAAQHRQVEDLQAQEPGRAAHLVPRAGLPARGAAQLPRADGLLAARRRGDLHLRRHGARASTGRGSTRSGRSSTSTSWTGSTATTSASCPSRTWPAASPITWYAAGVLPARADRRAARAWCSPRPRWSTSGCRCSPRPRGCSASCSSTTTDFALDPDDAAKVLTAERAPGPRRDRRSPRSAGLDDLGRPPTSRRRCGRRWSRGWASSRSCAFGPVRVAVTGRRVSPPLFESLELLGRERSLARLRAALGARGVADAAGAAGGASAGDAPPAAPADARGPRGGARCSGCCSPGRPSSSRRRRP